MDQAEFQRIERATRLAIDRVLSKGADDVFRPPIFAQSIEATVIGIHTDDFRAKAKSETIEFLKVADLTRSRIGQTQRGLVTKDQNSFRQCAWLDPFDAVKYLATAYMLFPQIEAARIPKEKGIVHSHRMCMQSREIFDADFGYDSFRSRSSELSRERIGKWKVVTDIANFFDRIGNHSLENHLADAGCDRKYVRLIREMLYFWARDRRSFGVPVGSDASRILSEAILLNVDAKLQEEGVTFLRYVDDFRVFADTRAEALKAIEILTTQLADEGLSLNSRKTDCYRIVDPEEINSFVNRLVGGTHEKINLEEKIEVKRAIRVSGRSSISRFYREPGRQALKKISDIPKEALVKNFTESAESDLEQQIKLVMKYFVYVDQDVTLLEILIDRKITSIYYISDALAKEESKFSSEKCDEIKTKIFNTVDWLKCPYPLQVPILRISGIPSFAEPKFVRAVIDRHLQTDNVLFYREALLLGAWCLDRERLRRLSIEVFQNVPNFVRRAIFSVVQDHDALTVDEKRPLLRTMRQHSDDWYINRI